MYLPKLEIFSKNCGQTSQWFCYGVSLLYDIYTVAIRTCLLASVINFVLVQYLVVFMML